MLGLASDPLEVVPTTDGRAFWKDRSATLWVSDGADGGATLATGALPSSNGQTIGTAGAQVFWLDASSKLNTGVLGTASIRSTARVTYGNTVVSTAHFLLRNGMIYWFDGQAVYRLPIP